jgi:hypothetical protein
MPKSPGEEAWNWLMNQFELSNRTPIVPTICSGLTNTHDFTKLGSVD